MGIGSLRGSSGHQIRTLAFYIMVNDLASYDALLWKYVDDITVSEVVSKGQASNVQKVVDPVEDWSRENKFRSSLTVTNVRNYAYLSLRIK